MLDTKPYRVKPGKSVKLKDIPSRDDGGMKKSEGVERFAKLRKRLVEQQEKFYACSQRSLLLVFQAMDAGGKDSTIRNVIGPMNPAGVRVWSHKAPNEVELKHDFLWRIHQHTPRQGFISIFNRSHYEDVLIVRVKDLAPKSVWKPRYEHINNFEQVLWDEGTTIIKFFLHISKDYQKERLQRRLDRPDKLWKFSPNDLKERAYWEKYQEAFEAVFEECSKDHAPWYIIPAERRWYRNLLVGSIVSQAIDDMKLKLPEPTFDPKSIVIE